MRFLEDLRLSRAPALAFLAIALFWAALAAQVPELKARIGASDAVFGVVFLVSSLGSLVAMWFAPQVDRWLGPNALALAIASMALAFFLPGLAPGVVTFTLTMVLAASGSGVADVIMNARVSELEARHDRPLMNLNHAVFSFAYAFAAMATGWARENAWSPVAVFSCCSLLVLALCPLMRQRDVAPAGSSVAAPAGLPAAGAPIVWLGGFVVLVAFLSESSVEGWSALHLERTLGGDPGQGAMGPAVLGLTMGFGRLFGQVIAARVREWVMIAVACVISAAGLLVAAAAQNLAWAYVGFGAMGLGASVVAPMALALVGRSVDEVARVAAIGRAALIGFLAFSIGPGLMGLSSEAFGLRWSFVIVAGLLVVTGVILAPRLGRLTDR
ncbi:MAG: MFS transporter [Pseudomonadota bacterium]